MKVYLLGTAALAALIASPAAARDRSAYFGLEIGPMGVRDTTVEINGSDIFDVEHKLGVDGDLIAGYDFGLIRAELEGSHKWAKHDDYDSHTIVTFDDADGHSRAYSVMGNVLLDFGKNEVVNFYVGGGAGIAWVRETHGDATDEIEDSGLAWQLIAGVRAPVFRHFDIGLKYRYFDAGRIKDEFDGFDIRSRFRSHSLLASLIYNFADVPPPPPPPPPPPEPVRGN